MSWQDTVAYTVPSNIYPSGTIPKEPEYKDGKKKWRDRTLSGPANPQGYKEFEFKRVVDDDSLISIAEYVTKNCNVPIDGLELARFNWDTTIPSEINWYLHYYVGCVNTTDPNGLDEGHNLLFHNAVPSQGIWIPKKIEPPKPAKKKSSKTAPNVLKVKGCPKRRAPGKCIVRKGFPEAERPACRKTVSDQAFATETVTVKEKLKRHARRIEEMEHAKSMILTYYSYRIVDHVALPEKSVRKEYVWEMGELSYQLMEERLTMKREDNPKPKKSSTSRKWPLEQDYLADPDELKNIATDLKILYQAGWITRIIIRGYAGKNEERSRDDAALSLARAMFVREQLKRHYGLPFPNIDVLVIGCGAIYADGTKGVKNRAVVIETEVSEPVKKMLGDMAAETSNTWTFHRYRGQGWKPGFMRKEIEVTTLYKDQDRLNKEVDSADLKAAKNGAFACVDLFDEVMGEINPVDVYNRNNGFYKHLDNIRDWIHSWNIVDPQGYGVRELKGSHSIRNKVTNKKMTVKSGEADDISPNYSIRESGPMINIAYGLSKSTYKEIKNNAAGTYKINLTGMVVHFQGNKPSVKDVVQEFKIKPSKK